ncbi:hypothetical protein F2P79_024380 [Pimephales promelas]|nr:hypothetical protein F2P79_024380 [Pimephales promelas]
METENVINWYTAKLASLAVFTAFRCVLKYVGQRYRHHTIQLKGQDLDGIHTQYMTEGAIRKYPEWVTRKTTEGSLQEVVLRCLKGAADREGGKKQRREN